MPSERRRTFAFDGHLKREFRYQMSPDQPVCRFYAMSSCPRGRSCPDSHILPAYSGKIVCRHWLRGLCKKGDHCEYLHEYRISKLPECAAFERTGYCPQIPDCPFRHTDPEIKIPLCTAYERGFCRAGPKCTFRHNFRQFCPLYLTGFCPNGPTCPLGHPRFVQIDDTMRIAPDPVAPPAWQKGHQAASSGVS